MQSRVLFPLLNTALVLYVSHFPMQKKGGKKKGGGGEREEICLLTAGSSLKDICVKPQSLSLAEL